MVEEISNQGKQPGPTELTFHKLNNLIKDQLKFLLIPDDNNENDSSGNNKENNKPSSQPSHHVHHHHHPSQTFITEHNIANLFVSRSLKHQNSKQQQGEPTNASPQLVRRNGYTLGKESTPSNESPLPAKPQSEPNGKIHTPKGSNSTSTKPRRRRITLSNIKSLEDLKEFLNPFLRLLEILICDTFLTFFLPIIAPLMLLNFIWRWILTIYYRVRHKGSIRLMRGEDAFWAFESPANPGNFTSMYVIEGDGDLNKIREKLSSSWVEQKDSKGQPMFSKLKLKAIQTAGYFAWQFHETFDINEHIRYLHPESPSRITSEDELFEEIKNFYDVILPDDKPQWEILVVPNYVYNDTSLQNKTHYAVIFRIHHSIMDGLSAAQALRMIVADNIVQAGVDPMKPIKAPWYQRVLLYVVALFLTGPYVLRHNYVAEEDNPFWSGDGLTGPKNLGWSRPIRLDAVKKIKEASKTSITAVFSACIGGAFRNFAESKGHPLPGKVTAATCAALIPYPNLRAQNRFCVLFTPLAVKESNTHERVQIAQKSFENQFLAAAEVVMAYWITWIGGCFPIFVNNWLQYGICHGTVLLSNLPGPLTTTKIFGGDKIVDIVGWSPIRNRIGTLLKYTC
jgi:hypothetical protein